MPGRQEDRREVFQAVVDVIVEDGEAEHEVIQKSRSENNAFDKLEEPATAVKAIELEKQFVQLHLGKEAWVHAEHSDLPRQGQDHCEGQAVDGLACEAALEVTGAGHQNLESDVGRREAGNQGKRRAD